MAALQLQLLSCFQHLKASIDTCSQGTGLCRGRLGCGSPPAAGQVSLGQWALPLGEQRHPVM